MQSSGKGQIFEQTFREKGVSVQPTVRPDAQAHSN